MDHRVLVIFWGVEGMHLRQGFTMHYVTPALVLRAPCLPLPPKC